MTPPASVAPLVLITLIQAGTQHSAPSPSCWVLQAGHHCGLCDAGWASLWSLGCRVASLWSPGFRAGDRDTRTGGGWGGMPVEASLCRSCVPAPEGFFIAGFGFGKQLTQHVPEALRHLRISQLGAARCHHPAIGDSGGTGLRAQPEDRLSLGTPDDGDTSLHSAQGWFSWGTPWERDSSCTTGGWGPSNSFMFGFAHP